VIKLEVTGEAAVNAKFGRMPHDFLRELKASMNTISVTLRDNVVKNKLQGQVLGVRTGTGQRSIHFAVSESGDLITGAVSTGLFYMIGWERGWGPRKKTLSDAKAASKIGLAMGGGDTFANGTPRKRPFLVPSLREMIESGAIQDELQNAVSRALRS
jgi:hypothetical protein